MAVLMRKTTPLGIDYLAEAGRLSCLLVGITSHAPWGYFQSAGMAVQFHGDKLGGFFFHVQFLLPMMEASFKNALRLTKLSD